MDETGLFWRSLPRKTLATADEYKPTSIKEEKERITIAVCSNAAGTHKCNLLVVGKSAHPRALKGVKMLPVLYRSNKRAWVTREIVTEWFQNHFVNEARAHSIKAGFPANTKILLLLDNCTAHTELLEKDNVAALFLPPNTTSLIQPMDQGIIRTLKHNYKIEVLRRLVNLEPLADMLQNHKKNFNIKDCLFLLADAWNAVSQETLVHAWHNVWPSSLFIETEDDESIFEGFNVKKTDTKFVDLLHFAKQSLSGVLEDEEINNWVISDENAPITEKVTDEEIISSTLCPQNSSSETDSDEELENLNLEEGLSLGDKYLNFLLQQDFVLEQEIMTVQRLQDKINKQRNKSLKQTTILSMFKKSV